MAIKKMKKTTGLLCAALMLALTVLAGCGGGGGGSTASTPATGNTPTPSFTGTGNGKVAATVKLTGRVGGRMAAQTADATVDVTITISGVYSGTGAEFTPVSTSYPINLSQGYARVSVVNVPVGVNHLVVAEAFWGSATETVKAIIPMVTADTVTTVTADAASTVVADTAIYYAAQNGIKLAGVPAEQIDKITKAVSQLAKTMPYSSMNPADVLAYTAGMDVATSLSLTPATATVVVGETLQFTASVLDKNNVAMTDTALTWALDPAALGSIDPAGLFSASLAGSGSVTATYLTLSASSQVTVTATCVQDTDCNDGVDLTLDACSSPGTVSAACSHTAIACNTTADCDDSNALTIDTCANGGTASAACSNTTIACNEGLDCDDSNALTLDVCANGGTLTAACSNTAFACNVDTDCNDNVSGTNDICTNGGTLAAACSNTNKTALVTSISAGKSHVCAVQPDTTVQCWGYNNYGQIGNGETGGGGYLPRPAGRNASQNARMQQATARKIAPKGTSRRATSGRPSASRTAQRAAAISGSIATPMYVPEPVTVVGLTGAVQVAAGSYHTCALLSDTTVQCWGAGSDGQLGDGNYSDSPTPVAVSDGAGGSLTGVTAITAGAYHTCAIIDNDTVKCWGYGEYGQMGDGSGYSSYIPTDVWGINGASFIDAGADHTCVVAQSGGGGMYRRAGAVYTAGNIYCWGYNYDGQLGDGSSSNAIIPVAVSDGAGGTLTGQMVSAGESHTCALMEDGTAKCWGSNYNGELGDGTFDSSYLPVQVSGVTGATSVSTGFYTSCATISGGAAQCWGYNWFGQLGNIDNLTYDTYEETLPVTVNTVGQPITGIAMGMDNYNCFTYSVGTYKCAGFNEYGQLGDGRATKEYYPISEFGINGFEDYDNSDNFGCFVMNDLSLKCWGSSYDGQIGNGNNLGSYDLVDVSGISGVTKVATGDYHTCVLLSDSTVKCWGAGYDGALGDGLFTDSVTPVTVSDGAGGTLTGVADIDSNYSTTCALMNDTTMKCWGLNIYGQIGNGTTTNAGAPETVSDGAGGALSGVTAISVGPDRTCALMNDTTVKCWGYGYDGQLGTGGGYDSSVPVAVSDGAGGSLTGVVELSVGETHNCVLMLGGTMKCWGANYLSQIGDGTTNGAPVPVDVLGLSGIVSMGAGNEYSCALLSAGNIKCWGSDILGNGDFTSTSYPDLQDVLNITDATELYINPMRACAMTAGKGMMCWGYDLYTYNMVAD